MAENLFQLPNELWVEIFSYVEGTSLDLVENSALMDKVLLKCTLSKVSQGMKELALGLFGDLAFKFPSNQWAILLTHRGYLPLLKELEAKKKIRFDAWIYQVAANANQTEVAAYLETKIDAKLQDDWHSDLKIVMDQTEQPKWKAFEALRKNAGDIVNAILELVP